MAQGDGMAEFETGINGLAKLTLHTRAAEAEVYLHGAHVTGYQPRGMKPVLWLSGHSWFEDGKPIRGGVPICFPWFGPREGDPQAPAHGFVRLAVWKAESVEQSDDRTSVTLLTTDTPQTRALWDHAFELRQTVALGPDGALIITLACRNTGAKAFSFTEALHTYLHVDDVRQVAIEGLAGVEYIDKMDAGRRKRQDDEPIRFTGETDRVYLDTDAACTLTDPKAGRRIIVRKEGSRSTVIWNPWTDKSIRMPDFGDNEWPGMVCIETANAADNAVTLEPGAEHRMSAGIHAEPL